MTNFDTAREALDTSLNSSGSAMKEHEKWQQSLEAQINKLKASWQGLSQAFLKSDFLKATLDAVIDLVDGVTKLIDTFGAFPTLLGVFAAFKGIPTIFSTISKTVSELGGVGTLKLKSFGDVLSLLQLSFPKTAAGASKLSDAFKNLKSSGGGATGVMSKFKSVLSSGNVYVAAAVIAITALTAVITHQKKEAEELAKEVEELTSKYKEKHDALKDLEGDFDTSNESSMISRYEKLSKGVDNLGKNVSLTSEEYSEYQGIVNSIAERMPSIVSGYNDQGNALLGVKDNVEELVAAYEKLIHVENQDMLANTGDIEQNFANTVKNASDYDLLERFGNLFSFDGAFGGKMEVFDMKLSTVEWLSKLEQGMSEEEISKQIANFHDYGIEEYASQEIAQALQKAGYDSANYYSGVPETLEEILEKEPEKLQAIIDDYYAQFDDVVGQQKAIAAAKLSEAFDVSDVISGVDYGNISEELKTIAYQTVNSLDFKFFEELSNSGKTVEQWTTEMLKQLNSLSDTDNKTIETGFELQTQFNGGDISYGEYVNSLRDVEKTIDGLDLKEEVKEQLKLSLDLDEEGVVDQYDALVNRLTSKDDKLGLGLD